MNIEKIKKGKIYYHTLATNSVDKATQLKIKDTRKVFVCEVDKVKRLVCASINGAPAQWFDGNKFTRWTAKHPDKIKTKSKTKKPTTK